ncbi:MAG: hypothetical protein GF346_10845 [Candidatus Eisenbacteria bacterium]|nr:hypothetical protein [Candidatus Latescibacterota bacterium]MBD3302934.1 hypothetical protein [Candidatus Eisenbacteria bacterium]
MRLQVPLFICAIAGIFMAIQYFIPAARPLYERISDYLQIVYAFSIVLGVASVLNRHGTRIKTGHRDAIYSVATIGSMALMMIAGFAGGADRGEMLFQDLFNSVLLPVQATMFSLLAFYLASASFRAFRTRSLDATILLIAAVIVMIGRLDEGQALGLPEIQRWILDGPNLVSKRAIILGVGLGMASTALKVVLGIERSYLGRGGG